ncbi:MAG: hypothetical protein IAE97_01075 [Chthoniobacterales bacterium]|nr:hypothetical protein [Chthoniobacterales bacterium]
MKRHLALIIWLSSLGLAFAQDAPFKLKPLRELQSRELIKVGSAWLDSPDRIQTGLRVSSDTDPRSVFIKAYFYDNQNNLIHTYTEPCPIWTKTARGIEEVGLPDLLTKGDEAPVYFAITEELKKKKWKSVVVVFGNSTQVAARCKPQTAYANLEFPEKALVKSPE